MDLQFPMTARDLALQTGGTLAGDGNLTITHLSSLGSAKAGALCFFSHEKFKKHLASIKDAVVLSHKDYSKEFGSLAFVCVDFPQLEFAKIARLAQDHQNEWDANGHHPTAVISNQAKVSPQVDIGAYVVIEAGAQIGRGTILHPFAYIGRGVKVGEDCEVFSRVSLLPGTEVGDRVSIRSHTVVGSPGFGFLTEASGKISPMPQIGGVRIENDVVIGAGCTIDRATLDYTMIGEGAKLDDQVHVGHNSVIGKNCILCGLVGISGSAVLEDGVILGGQVGVSDGAHIEAGARVSGKSGVQGRLKGNQTYWGTPAAPMKKAMEWMRLTRRLPSLAKRLKKIEGSWEEKTK